MVNPPRMPLPADPRPAPVPAWRGDAARRFKAALAPGAGVRVCPADHVEPGEAPGEAPVRQSHDQLRPPGDHAPAPDLAELWDELVMTLQAGQRLSANDWRLRLRLDPRAFPDTALLLACTAGALALTVRTASAPVHARLQAQWTGLEARLRGHARTVDAALLHVPLEELDT